MGPRLHLWFCACKTAWLAPEILVSMGSSPHLSFLHVKQRRLDPNNKSLWVPDITCRFVHAKLRNNHQNNLSLWVPALICCFCTQNSDFWTSIQVSMGTRPHLSFCVYKTAWLAPEILVSMDPSPHAWFLDAKQRLLAWNKKSLWVPGITHRFVHANQRDLHQNDKSI